MSLLGYNCLRKDRDSPNQHIHHLFMFIKVFQVCNNRDIEIAQLERVKKLAQVCFQSMCVFEKSNVKIFEEYYNTIKVTQLQWLALAKEDMKMLKTKTSSSIQMIWVKL